jgi:hypothetical protein
MCHETSEICVDYIGELDSVLRWLQSAHSHFFTWQSKKLYREILLRLEEVFVLLFIKENSQSKELV